MNLKFKVSNLDYAVNSICDFQKDNDIEFFNETLFMLYPQIEKNIFDNLKTKIEKQLYLKSVLTDIYNENKQNIIKKSQAYQLYWDSHQKDIFDRLENVFEIELKNIFNDIEARVGINPISPRYLNENAFDIIHLYSQQGAAMVSLHEIVHFIWFYIWGNHFNDNSSEYEAPNIKWIFSEMVPDMIIKKAELNYLNKENRSTIYPYFDNLIVNDERLLEILENILFCSDMKSFMEEGYEIIIKNEKEISAQIL